ncbi:MAG: hypothetical protein HKN76_19910 [Saprospiraceae bacterium]|nr:hypothetical protein [Saprospiraceae bacterium]
MSNIIIVKHGTILFLALTTYFLVMHLLGLGERYDFRIFNAIIQIIVIYLAIRSYAKLHREQFTYLNGTLIGIKTTVWGIIPFAILQMFHLYLNQPLLEYIRENAPVVGPYVTPFSGGVIIFMEGLAVGLIVSYICMRIVDLKITPARKPYVVNNGNHARAES